MVLIVTVFTASAVMAAAAFAMRFVLDVSKGYVDNVHNMLVIQRVKNVFAVTAALYQTFVLKEAELVGNCGFGHVQG